MSGSSHNGSSRSPPMERRRPSHSPSTCPTTPEGHPLDIPVAMDNTPANTQTIAQPSAAFWLIPATLFVTNPHPGTPMVTSPALPSSPVIPANPSASGLLNENVVGREPNNIELILGVMRRSLTRLDALTETVDTATTVTRELSGAGTVLMAQLIANGRNATVSENDFEMAQQFIDQYGLEEAAHTVMAIDRNPDHLHGPLPAYTTPNQCSIPVPERLVRDFDTVLGPLRLPSWDNIEYRNRVLRILVLVCNWSWCSAMQVILQRNLMWHALELLQMLINTTRRFPNFSSTEWLVFMTWDIATRVYEARIEWYLEEACRRVTARHVDYNQFNPSNHRLHEHGFIASHRFRPYVRNRQGLMDRIQSLAAHMRIQREPIGLNPPTGLPALWLRQIYQASGELLHTDNQVPNDSWSYVDEFISLMRDTSNLENPSSHLAIDPVAEYSGTDRRVQTGVAGRDYTFQPGNLQFPSLRHHNGSWDACTGCYLCAGNHNTSDHGPSRPNGANANQTMVMWDSQNRSYIVVEPATSSSTTSSVASPRPQRPVTTPAQSRQILRDARVARHPFTGQPRTPEPRTLHPVSNQRSHRPRSRRTPEHTAGIRSVSGTPAPPYTSPTPPPPTYATTVAGLPTARRPVFHAPQRTVIDITNKNEAPVETLVPRTDAQTARRGRPRYAGRGQRRQPD